MTDRMRAPAGVVAFLSNSEDPVGAAFADYCRARDLDVVLATRQPQTQFWFEIAGEPAVTLRIERPDAAPVEQGHLRGIWFRDVPDRPPDLDEDDAEYAATEFSASLAACFAVSDVRCLGSRALTGSFDAIPTIHDVHQWCAGNGLAILPAPDCERLGAIPTEIAAPGEDEPVARRDPLANGIYYVLLGNRRQVLAPDGVRPEVLLRALDAGDNIAAMLALDSGVIEFDADPDAPLALGEICSHVPPAIILKDPAWYFGAVLEALGV